MWAQPWAWLGLAGLAVPIAIHLLARHQAVRAAFPTLRFIDASELNAIKRQRLTDIPLLLVRMLMVALAVAAIAGPRLGAASINSNQEPAHATVYDMTLSAASGRSDSFIALSRRAHIGAQSLAAGIAAAARWAERQPGQREITVVSDFQRGSLDDAAVRAVPEGIGLHFEKVPSTPVPAPVGLTLTDDRTRMVWPPDKAPNRAIRALAGPDQAIADELIAAVLSVTPAADVAGSLATVVFPGAPERATVLASMRPIDQPWQFDAAQSLMAQWPSAARVGVDSRGGQLMAVVDLAPNSLDASEAVASIARAIAGRAPASESDPRVIDDAQLKAWERAATPSGIERTGEPQGKWLWMGVLALLAVETMMRRRAA